MIFIYFSLTLLIIILLGKLFIYISNIPPERNYGILAGGGIQGSIDN